MNPTWSFIVTPSAGFLVGDKVVCSSELNNKDVYIQRGSSKFLLADKIAPFSVWPIMFPGDNNIAILESSKFSWRSISYYPTYWGV